MLVAALPFGSAGVRAQGASPVVPLPEGSGRELVSRACGQCHSIETALKSRRTRTQWEAQLDAMIARGAKISDGDFELIADYLAEHFGSPP